MLILWIGFLLKKIKEQIGDVSVSGFANICKICHGLPQQTPEVCMVGII